MNDFLQGFRIGFIKVPLSILWFCLVCCVWSSFIGIFLAPHMMEVGLDVIWGQSGR